VVTLAFAALVVLAVDPHSIFTISFSSLSRGRGNSLAGAGDLFSDLLQATKIRKGMLYRFYSILRARFCDRGCCVFLLPVTSSIFTESLW